MAYPILNKRGIEIMKKNMRSVLIVEDNLNHVVTPSVVSVIKGKLRRLFNRYIWLVSKMLFSNFCKYDPKTQAYIFVMIK